MSRALSLTRLSALPFRREGRGEGLRRPSGEDLRLGVRSDDAAAAADFSAAFSTENFRNSWAVGVELGSIGPAMDALPSLGESTVLCLRGPVGVGGREDRDESCAAAGCGLADIGGSEPLSLARSSRGALGVGRRGSVGGSMARVLVCPDWFASREDGGGVEPAFGSR